MNAIGELGVSIDDIAVRLTWCGCKDFIRPSPGVIPDGRGIWLYGKPFSAPIFRMEQSV